MDYAEKAQAADRMIRQYGAASMLVSTAVTYDAAAGQTAQAEVRQDAQMVAFPYPQRFIDGTVIRMGDMQAFVSAVGIASPKPGDRIEWGGMSYAVMSVKPLSPALTAVLYEVQLRG